MFGESVVSPGSVGSNPALRTSVPDIGGKPSFEQMRSIWYSPDWFAIASIIASAPPSSSAQCKVRSSYSGVTAPRLSPSTDPAAPQALSLQPRSTTAAPNTNGGATPPPANGQSAANAKGSSGAAQKLPKLTIPGTLQDPHKKNAITEVIRGIWAHPSVKAAIQNQARRFGLDFGKTAKAAAATQTVILSSGVVAGILGNKPARYEALQKLNGKQIPVPGTGLSFRIYTRKEPNSEATRVTGGAIHIKAKPVEFGQGFNQVLLPNGDTIVNEQFSIALDLHWIINEVRSSRKKR